MQTGILVMGTLLVWHPSGCPLCPWAGPGCCLGDGSTRCRVGGLLGPQPLVSATGAGSGLVTVCLGKTQGAAYVGRDGREFPSRTQSLV